MTRRRRPSVANALRDDLRRREIEDLTVDERIRLALELGRRDLEAFRLNHEPELTIEEARAELRRRRQLGRRPSRCMQGDPAT